MQSRAVVMPPSLPEFNKHLGNSLIYVVRLLGGPVWSQELDSMILVDPFQLRIFYESKLATLSGAHFSLGGRWRRRKAYQEGANEARARGPDIWLL